MPLLEFTAKLSQSGIRSLHLDLSGPLEYDATETLTGGTVTVTSSNTALVTISGDGPSTTTLTNPDGSTVAAGLAAIYTVTAVTSSTSLVRIRILWVTASGNTADTHEIQLTLIPYVTE